MSAPAVAVTSDGKKFAVAWKDVRAGSPRVWWASGPEPRFQSEQAVAEGRDVERNHPSIAVDARGEFWVAWEEGGGPSARIRARSSGSRGDARDVTDASAGAPAFPVTACGAGLVVVAWETTDRTAGERIYLRVLEDAR